MLDHEDSFNTMNTITIFYIEIVLWSTSTHLATEQQMFTLTRSTMELISLMHGEDTDQSSDLF